MIAKLQIPCLLLAWYNSKKFPPPKKKGIPSYNMYPIKEEKKRKHPAEITQ